MKLCTLKHCDSPHKFNGLSHRVGFHIHMKRGHKRAMFGLVLATLTLDFIARGPSLADLAFFWAVVLDVVEEF